MILCGMRRFASREATSLYADGSLTDLIQPAHNTRGTTHKKRRLHVEYEQSPIHPSGVEKYLGPTMKQDGLLENELEIRKIRTYQCLLLFCLSS